MPENKLTFKGQKLRSISSSTVHPMNMQLAILAARLEAKSTDNDSLFRANAELALTNSKLQETIESLETKIQELLKSYQIKCKNDILMKQETKLFGLDSQCIENLSVISDEVITNKVNVDWEFKQLPKNICTEFVIQNNELQFAATSIQLVKKTKAKLKVNTKKTFSTELDHSAKSSTIKNNVNDSEKQTIQFDLKNDKNSQIKHFNIDQSLEVKSDSTTETNNLLPDNWSWDDSNLQNINNLKKRISEFDLNIDQGLEIKSDLNFSDELDSYGNVKTPKCLIAETNKDNWNWEYSNWDDERNDCKPEIEIESNSILTTIESNTSLNENFNNEFYNTETNNDNSWNW